MSILSSLAGRFGYSAKLAQLSKSKTPASGFRQSMAASPFKCGFVLIVLVNRGIADNLVRLRPTMKETLFHEISTDQLRNRVVMRGW